MNHSKRFTQLKGIRGSPLATVIALAGVFALAGCATAPPPSQELQAAESAITNAEQSRVADYASAELTIAREKLVAAQVATRKEDMPRAELLAVESRVHAELAYAQAEEMKAKAVNDEMQLSIDTLKQEMNRATGAR
jgi:outer membrane PBP1 activator LpoA protein